MSEYPYGANYYARALEKIVEITSDPKAARLAADALEGVWDDEADQESA